MSSLQGFFDDKFGGDDGDMSTDFWGGYGSAWKDQFSGLAGNFMIGVRIILILIVLGIIAKIRRIFS